VLGERSMYNISILDHLLVSAPKDAAVIVNRLAGGGTEERAFIDHYMSSGSAKDELVAQLTPLLSDVYTYIVDQAPLEREERVALLDTAIACRSDDMDYMLGEELRAFLEANYRGLASLTESPGALSPMCTVKFIANAGAVLPDVTALSPAACEALAGTWAYRLTAQNLQHLAGSPDIALDVLAQAPGVVYSNVINHLEEYLQANADSPGTRFTIDAPEAFVEVLQASKSWKGKDFRRLVDGANPDCKILSIEAAPQLAWPALAHSQRVPATFANVAAYVEWSEGVDTQLASLLSTIDRVTETDGVAESDRRSLALAIVNAGNSLTDSRRVKLARSLQPGVLPTSEVNPESGHLVGRLIAAKLIDDDEEAFDERLMLDWDTQEFAITKSRQYANMVGPATLKLEHIAPLMRSRKVDQAVQREVTNKVSGFSGVPKDAYQAVAECALASRVVLNTSGIEMVREGGASTALVMQLLAQAGDRITTDEVRQIMRGLPEPYSVLADKGTQRPTVPDTSANQTILDRLREAGIVSQTKPEKASRLRVILNQV
jgi:hypothetical protein